MPRLFYLPLVEPGVLLSLKAARKPAAEFFHSATGPLVEEGGFASRALKNSPPDCFSPPAGGTCCSIQEGMAFNVALFYLMT